MQGYNALWIPGTDHAGIGTQAVVERRLREEEGKTRHDLGRTELVNRIWKWKHQYEARILGQLRQLGASCDWRRTRFTLDAMCARAVRRTFFDLFSKDLIYRGKRLVNWDTFLQTAVSDDEVFHETVAGHFWHFRYPVIDPGPGEPTHVTIATTRPETMLADTAVAVHPDPAGALADWESELKAKWQSAPAKEKRELARQLEELEERRNSLLPTLEVLRQMAAAGRRLRLPLMDREIPLIADVWARPELGSGCVKITPAHDPNDYDVGRRHNLPMINILQTDGVLNSNAGSYQGLSIAAARQQVVADLDRLGLLAEIEDREIDLAHSDRSKTPIEPFLADQWFVRMNELAQSAMDAVTDGRVSILPSRYARGYLDWLNEKRDWPISRQLWWGHQIPVWSTPVRNQEELNERLAGLQQLQDRRTSDGRSPAAAGHTQVAHRIEYAGDDPDRPFAQLQVCVADGAETIEQLLESSGFVREPDVLDTWFSSALWPHSTLGWPEATPELAYYYPTSTLITSRDIITLWVARMVLAGLNNVGDVPFREVYIHPKILDGYGETMSKSKGNGVDPLDVIQKFGADALRFGLAYLTTDTQDVRMPVQFECPHCQELVEQTRQNRERPRIRCEKCRREFSTQWAMQPDDVGLPRGAVVSDRFELGRNFGNKLWNAARFVLAGLEGYAWRPLTLAELPTEDRWLLSRLSTVTHDVTEALGRYQFADAARSLYEFSWDEFCSFYIEMLKERLRDPLARPVAQVMAASALDQLLRLLHPFLPFITEEIWQQLGKIALQRGWERPLNVTPSVMISTWPVPQPTHVDAIIEERFARFQSALGAIREIRSRQGLPPRQMISFGVRCSEELTALLRPLEPYFAGMARATATGWGPHTEPPPTHAHANLPDMDIYVDLAGLIDIDAELTRQQKQRDKLRAMIAGKEKKLASKEFVERAPAEIVAREKDSLQELQTQLAAAESALAALQK
jgi:valyl-tRNA synthetase